MADKSAVIGLLRVLLSANTAEFESAMKRSTDSAKAWTKDLKQVGQQATQVGAALTKTLTLPIAGVGIAAAKLAIDFESSFAGVRKTVDGTEPQLAELAQGFRDLSKTIPVNVNDLNRLGEAAGALGVPRDKIVEFAAVMAKLGVSTNLTADQAADGIARIQNIFGAAGQHTERFASTLVALGNAGASTEKEIVEMSQRIAGAGHTVGLSQAQVLAFASTLASVGINAEAGGSAISRVFLKINDAVQKGGGGLAEFARVAGMSSAQFKTAFETNAAGATQAFVEGLGRLKAQGENINATIEGLTGKNIILKDTLFRLSGAGALLSDQLKIADGAWQSNTALTKEAGERFKTTESRMLLLGNRVKDVGITLGQALGPAIDLAIRGLNALIPVLEKIAGMFAALPDWVQLGIVAFAGIVAAAGPVIYVFGQIVLSASAVAGAFTKKGIATRLLVGNLDGLATSAVATTGKLALLGKAAGVAAAAFVGWEIGRLIADLFNLDKKIEESITHYKELKGLRDKAASGDAEAMESRLNALYKERAALLANGNANEAARVSARINAIKNDQTYLAIQDAINLAHSRGGAAVRTYAEAIAFNTKWATQQVDANQKVVEINKTAGPVIDKNTGATNTNTEAKAKSVGQTSLQTQVLNLLAKAHAHEAAALDFETSAWKNWEQAVSKALSTLKTAPVLLQGRNLSGIVPQIDAGGAGNLAGVDTHGKGAGLIGQLFGSSQQLGQQLAATIVGAFQGGGSALSSAVGQLGSSVASRFGESLTKTGGAFFSTALGSIFTGALPVVGSLIGPLVGKIWGSLFGTAGRDAVKDFAATFGGFDALHVQLNTLGADGERLWIKLTQGVGRNNPKEAQAAIEAIVAALAAQKQKQDDVAASAKASAEAQQEALDEIGAKYKTEIDALDSQWKSLSDSVAKEAKEEHMGITEMLEREEMKRIEDKKAALEEQRDAEIAAKKETFAETFTEAGKLDDKLREMFEKGYKIPLRFEFPDGRPPIISPDDLPAGYPGGGPGGWESQMPPAALTNGGRGGTAQFFMDGRLAAEMVVPHIPGVVKRLGLNR